MAAKFEVYKDKAGEFRFRLKAACIKGIESVKKNAPDAETVELEN